jgi:hypothetical protein
MEQLEGFTQEGEHLVCKLHKSLYELKQSPRAWNQKLDAFLKSFKFVRSDADFCDGVAILKIGGPPQGLFSSWEVEPFLGVANDNLQ